jgi:amidase
VPTTGHIPVLPGKPRSTRHINTIGPLARSVDDIELALQLIAGPDGHDWQVPPVPLEPQAARPVSELRFAVADDFGVPITADTRGALTRLAGDLERSGAAVQRVNLTAFGFDPAAAWEVFGEITQAEYGAGMEPDEELEIVRTFRTNRTDDDPMGRGMANAVNAILRFYAATLIRRDILVGALHAAFTSGGWDALLCPVSVGPAIPHCPTGTPIAVDDAEVPYWPAGIAYSSPFSTAGVPVLVAPLARSHNGLPIGVQIVGPRWSESRLFAVARVLEQFTGGFRRPPGY